VQQLAFNLRADNSEFYCYLPEGGCYAITSVCLSFFLSTCVQHYCKSDWRISLKLDDMIGLTSRKD